MMAREKAEGTTGTEIHPPFRPERERPWTFSRGLVGLSETFLNYLYQRWRLKNSEACWKRAEKARTKRDKYVTDKVGL